MKITLISPKGPLYRHRGGIFGKSLRYQPLTLTTLSALVPADLGAEITLIDQSIGEIPDRFFCPLTLEVMQDPVVTRFGNNFERKAIVEWIMTL